jgi:hypothetical protein
LVGVIGALLCEAALKGCGIEADMIPVARDRHLAKTLRWSFVVNVGLARFAFPVLLAPLFGFELIPTCKFVARMIGHWPVLSFPLAGFRDRAHMAR